MIQVPVTAGPLEGKVIVKQNGVPGIGRHPLGVAHLVLEDPEAVAEVIQVHVRAAVLFAVVAPTPRATRARSRGPPWPGGLPGQWPRIPALPHPRRLLAFHLAGHGQGGKGEMRAALQVLPFLDDPGGKGQAHGLAAVAAVGAGKDLDNSRTVRAMGEAPKTQQQGNGP